MQLTNLRLRDFRNHLDSSFQFTGGTNLLLGDNGEGKTNILEAISYLCLTKSFYASSDALALNFGADLVEIAGTFVGGGGREHTHRPRGLCKGAGGEGGDGEQAQGRAVPLDHRKISDRDFLSGIYRDRFWGAPAPPRERGFFFFCFLV